jgi:hypothetical protein
VAVQALHIGDPQGTGVFVTDLSFRGALSAAALAAANAGTHFTYDAANNTIGAAVKPRAQPGWLDPKAVASASEAAELLAQALAILEDYIKAFGMVACACYVHDGQVTSQLPHADIPCIARTLETLEPLLLSTRKLAAYTGARKISDEAAVSAVVQAVHAVHFVGHRFYTRAQTFAWGNHKGSAKPYLLPPEEFMDFTDTTRVLESALSTCASLPFIASLTAHVGGGASKRDRGERDYHGGGGRGDGGGDAAKPKRERARVSNDYYAFMVRAGLCGLFYKGKCNKKGATCPRGRHENPSVTDAAYAAYQASDKPKAAAKAGARKKPAAAAASSGGESN